MTDSCKRSVSDIRAWLIVRIGKYVGLEEEEIPVNQPVTRLGIDSTEAVVISGELQEWLGRRVAPTVLWDYSTIESLARFLGEE